MISVFTNIMLMHVNHEYADGTLQTSIPRDALLVNKYSHNLAPRFPFFRFPLDTFCYGLGFVLAGVVTSLNIAIPFVARALPCKEEWSQPAGNVAVRRVIRANHCVTERSTSKLVLGPLTHMNIC